MSSQSLKWQDTLPSPGAIIDRTFSLTLGIENNEETESKGNKEKGSYRNPLVYVMELNEIFNGGRLK
jgi:hypothetical protein